VPSDGQHTTRWANLSLVLSLVAILVKYEMTIDSLAKSPATIIITIRPFQIVLGTFFGQFGFGSTILIREHFFGQRASSDNFFGKQANF